MAHLSRTVYQAAVIIISLLTIPFTTQSCSVKEMRDACPCRVDLDLTELLECRDGCRQGTIEAAIFDASGVRLYSRGFGADTCARIYTLSVPRGDYRICALYFSDIDVWDKSGDIIELNAGAEADSLYGESAPLDTHAEEAVFRPAAYKQFTTVNVFFTSPVTGLAVEITAPSNALDADTLEGCGCDCHQSGIVDGQRFSRRICRQRSDDIIVSLRSSLSGRMIAQVSVASLMRSKAYDYQAKSLGDIDIMVDFGLGTITLETEGWKESFLNVIF